MCLAFFKLHTNVLRGCTGFWKLKYLNFIKSQFLPNSRMIGPIFSWAYFWKFYFCLFLIRKVHRALLIRKWHFQLFCAFVDKVLKALNDESISAYSKSNLRILEQLISRRAYPIPHPHPLFFLFLYSLFKKWV